MNTIGIDHNLDRPRIKKLLTIGLFASILTGIGDFLLGYAENAAGVSIATSVMASAPNLADWQMISGGLLGFFGIFLEGLSCFAIYRLMAYAAPKYAHLYRAGIFGYIWLAPVGCHLNVGVLNLAYKYLLQADEALAAKATDLLFFGFSLPIYLLLVIFWLPMMIIQFKAFAEGLTPYPKKAKMVLRADRLGPGVGTGCDPWPEHGAWRGHWHHVFELWQSFYVRRALVDDTGRRSIFSV